MRMILRRFQLEENVLRTRDITSGVGRANIDGMCVMLDIGIDLGRIDVRCF